MNKEISEGFRKDIAELYQQCSESGTNTVLLNFKNAEAMLSVMIVFIVEETN